MPQSQPLGFEHNHRTKRTPAFLDDLSLARGQGQCLNLAAPALPNFLLWLQQADPDLAGLRRAGLPHPDDAKLGLLPAALDDDHLAGSAQTTRAVNARAAAADVDRLHAFLERIAVGVYAFDGDTNFLRDARLFRFLRVRFACGRVLHGCLSHGYTFVDRKL